uniref:Cytochrome P450 n=1 Tax=Neobodo designis TaxID=312471 RepID=A0A7S1LRE0_NEODS
MLRRGFATLAAATNEPSKPWTKKEPSRSIHEVPGYLQYKSQVVGVLRFALDAYMLTPNHNPQAAFAKTLSIEPRFALPPNPEGPKGLIMTSDPDDIDIVANQQGEDSFRGPPPFPWDEYWKEMPDMPVTYTLSRGPEYNHAIWLWKDRLQSDKKVIPRFGKHMYTHVKRFSEMFAKGYDRGSGKNDQWYKLVAKSIGDQCNEMQSGQDTRWVTMTDDEMDEKGELEYYVAVRDLGGDTIDLMTSPLAHIFNTEKKKLCKSYWKIMYTHSKRLTEKTYEEAKKPGGKFPDKGCSIFQDTMEYRDVTKHAMPSTEDPGAVRPVINSFERMAMCNLEYIIGVMDPASQLVQNILKHLAKFPEWQEKVHAEAKEIMAKVHAQQELTLEDWQNAKVYTAFVNETCRYFPLFDVHKRWLTTPTMLADGTYCPNDVTVVVNYGAMCKDPKNYPDPGKFDPTRFLDWKKHVTGEFPPVSKDGKPVTATAAKEQSEECPFEDGKIIKSEAFCPWGMGKRMCSGIGWALPVVGLIVMELVAKYKIVYTEPEGVKVTYLNSVPSKPTPPIEGFFSFETRVDVAKVANSADGVDKK